MSLGKHLTYANGTASLALFISLGGGAYALTIPRNSVGGKQLKANAVTSVKVKNRSLRAVDFRAGQLPAGAIGPRGLPGPAGPAGPTGATGPQGPVDRHWTGQSYEVKGVVADNSADATTSADVRCDTDDPLIGGGYESFTSAAGTLKTSAPTIRSAGAGVQHGWRLVWDNSAPNAPANVAVIARCADFPPLR